MAREGGGRANAAAASSTRRRGKDPDIHGGDSASQRMYVSPELARHRSAHKRSVGLRSKAFYVGTKGKEVGGSPMSKAQQAAADIIAHETELLDQLRGSLKKCSDQV